MTAAVTEWFPGDQKPNIVGVYERDLQFSISPLRFSRWDGEIWYGYCGSIENAELDTEKSCYQKAPWRGLASDPKGIK